MNSRNQPEFSVQCLGSGSSGNSFLIEHNSHLVLLDCGIGVRTVQRALRSRGRELGDIEAILLTHEHSDHTNALPKIARHNTLVYSTDGTRIGARLHTQAWQQLVFNKPQQVCGMTVWALEVSHDAREPCGFLIETESGTAAILTDLGRVQPNLVEPLLASDLIVLEANHDLEMLRRGPYPQYLKKRVMSHQGHLSNIDHGEFISDIVWQHRKTPTLWLAHLSRTNNHPEVATATIRSSLHRVADADPEVLPLSQQLNDVIWRAEGEGDSQPFQPHPLLPKQQELFASEL